MRGQIADELIHLSPAGERKLGEALIASADVHTDSPPPLTNAQRTELRARLAHHRASPSECGVSMHELKAKLLGVGDTPQSPL